MRFRVRMFRTRSHGAHKSRASTSGRMRDARRARALTRGIAAMRVDYVFVRFTGFVR